MTHARDLGAPFDGTPGPLSAITEVAGVQPRVAAARVVLAQLEHR